MTSTRYNNMSQHSSSLEIAFRPDVARRALIMALIVGAILIAINHGTCIATGDFNSVCLLRSVMTFFVPYAVSTVSSVLAIKCNQQSERDR
jgi:hypothetical protein